MKKFTKPDDKDLDWTVMAASIIDDKFSTLLPGIPLHFYFYWENVRQIFNETQHDNLQCEYALSNLRSTSINTRQIIM